MADETPSAEGEYECPGCGKPMYQGYWASTRRCESMKCDVGTLPVEVLSKFVALRAENAELKWRLQGLEK